MNSLLPPDDRMGDSIHYHSTELVGEEEVSISTIETYCREAGLKTVDVLKSDTQGYDLEVIKGAGSLLNIAGGIKLIVTEVCLAPLYKGQATMEQMIAFLHSKGYRLIDIYGKHRDSRHCLQYCDLMFGIPEQAGLAGD